MDINTINLTSVLLSKKEQIIEEYTENYSICVKLKNIYNIQGIL